MTAKLKINISGPTGSGKTMLLNMIGALLKEHGFNVRCVDDFGEVTPSDTPRCPSRTDRTKIIIKTKIVP